MKRYNSLILFLFVFYCPQVLAHGGLSSLGAIKASLLLLSGAGFLVASLILFVFGCVNIKRSSSVNKSSNNSHAKNKNGYELRLLLSLVTFIPGVCLTYLAFTF